jgi:hypothetical protein
MGMASQGNSERPQMVVSGRILELKRLQACERALGEAFTTFARERPGGARCLEFAVRHREHARLLGVRIAELGGSQASQDVSDDEWLMGPPDQLSTLVYAEHMALRTYHDHLQDLDPASLVLVREHILPGHERTLQELVGERDLVSWEP